MNLSDYKIIIPGFGIHSKAWDKKKARRSAHMSLIMSNV